MNKPAKFFLSWEEQIVYKAKYLFHKRCKFGYVQDVKVYLFSFVETPRKFITAELSIRIVFTMQTYKKLI